jgi:hypothetical protein
MQPLDPEFEEFPYCKHYIAEFLSDEKKFKKKYFHVYSAFEKACTIELDKAQLARARLRISQVFQPDRGPLVSISDTLLPNEAGVFKPGAAGTQFSRRRFITVSKEVAESYEVGHGWINWEGTILHECVHWVRFHAGNGDEEGGAWNTLTYERLLDGNQEIGELFELWAYKFFVAQRASNGKLIQFGPPETLPTVKPR